MMSFAATAQFDIDVTLTATFVRTSYAIARPVRAALAMLQDHLALRLLLALFANPGSGFQTSLAALGQHVVHFAVASAVHALRVFYDTFIVAVAVFVQFGAR